MMNELEPSILVVEDEFLIATVLSLHIENMGIVICGTAPTADEAIELAQKYRPAVVLMDVRLRGDKDGVDAALVIHDTVGSKVVFVTGSRDEQTMARIRMDHPQAILFKPVSEQLLREAVTMALAK